MSFFADRLRDAGVLVELRRLRAPAENDAEAIEELAAFCELFAIKRARILRATTAASAYRLSTAAAGLRKARAAIKHASELSPTPWLTVPRDFPLPPTECAKPFVFAGNVEDALSQWADRLDAAALDAREEGDMTVRQRMQLRSLHIRFRLAFLRLAHRRFGSPAHTVGAIAFGLTFRTIIDADAYRKAVGRAEDQRPTYAAFLEALRVRRERRREQDRTKRA